jgi:hypothetical protein
MPENKVQRTFFIDPGVDSELSRMALRSGVSKNELTREILEKAMKPFVQGKQLPGGLTHGPASDAGEGLKDGMVMRSIYLPPELDSFLRHTAFTQRYSKSELMRHFIGSGLSQARKARPTANVGSDGAGGTSVKRKSTTKKSVSAKKSG